MVKWSKPLGLPDGPLSFQDLFSLDPEFLQFIPKPVKAVLLLFPSRGELAAAREKEEKEGEGKFEGNVWWIKQTVGQSCPGPMRGARTLTIYRSPTLAAQLDCSIRY